MTKRKDDKARSAKASRMGMLSAESQRTESIERHALVKMPDIAFQKRRLWWERG